MRFQNKYRIESARCPSWDYRRKGYYFVTICTDKRRPLFGVIMKGEMRLTIFGQIARNAWIETCNKRDNLKLDEFVVMPDHFHAIVAIIYNKTEHARDVARYVSCSNCTSPSNREHPMPIPPRPGSLSAIIRAFKSAVTKRIHEITRDDRVIWQTRFHDYIVRNRIQLRRIRRYIRDNPKRCHK